MADFLARYAGYSTLAAAVQEFPRTTSYDDYVLLALMALGAASYLSEGKIWNKPDPYYQKWFDRPQNTNNSLGLQSRTRNVAQKIEETQRDLVIFWGSQSGTAEAFANRLARDCYQRFRLKALVADLSDYDPATVAQISASTFAIFLVSTYGEGDPSDNATEFVSWLTASASLSLELALRGVRTWQQQLQILQ